MVQLAHSLAQNRQLSAEDYETADSGLRQLAVAVETGLKLRAVQTGNNDSGDAF